MARELFLRLRWFLALAVAAAAHSHDGDALSDSYAARNADVDPEEEAGECGCSKSRADAAGSCAAESRADAAGVCAADAAAPMPASPASAPAASASAASASAASFAASLAALAPAPPARLQRVVRLPAGARARLGTDAPHFSEDGEAPSFEFALPAPLWVDVYEVTNARWAAFVRATGHVSDAEKYGWSFVHEQAVSSASRPRGA